MSYHIVGSSIDDMFIYVDNAGVETTGKVQGDFTIQLSKDGVGNQSTTGITITEIDATNNAGEYAVAASGATGFPAAVGDYFLVIYDTAAPQYRWSSTFRVTVDGAATAVDGVAFTPVADDGRVTGDDTALSGATIRIRDSGGTVIAQYTSDVDGLWGPVYLNDSSSYSMYVQATGYTTATSAITTTGGVATGPGADVDIITASTVSELQASKLWAFARRQAGDRVGSKATTQIKRAVNDALGLVGKSHRWPWLTARGRINVRSFSDSGTITVTDDSAIVTLDSAVWPTWVAGCEFLYGGVATKISTRDSDTQITLEFAFNGTTASAQEYVVFQYKYTLPVDCLQVDTLYGGTRFPQGARFVDMATLEHQRDILNFSSVDQYLFSAAAGTLAVWPYPSQDRMLNYTYYKKPADLVSDSVVADWDIACISLLYRAIEYHLAITMGCVSGGPDECKSRFLDELALHIPNSKSTANARLAIGMPGMGTTSHSMSTIITAGN